MKIKNIYKQVKNNRRRFRRQNISYMGVFYAVILPFALCACFLASVIFTPLGGIIGNMYGSFLKDGASVFNSRTVLSILFGGTFPTFDKAAAEVVDSETVLVSSEQESVLSGYSDEEEDYSFPSNGKITNDQPITSVYEYYTAASGLDIKEVEQPAGEIPYGESAIKPINLSGQKTSIPQLLLNNQTTFKVDLPEYLLKKYPIADYNPNSAEPVVLILCTHATESYVADGTYYYSPPFTAERTTDNEQNVVLIASKLRETLEKNGISVIQSTKLHDALSYKDAYKRSLETMESIKEQYPSIKYIIDVHRDSLIQDSGVKLKPAINIDNEDTAQLMMVVGTSDGGASHPNWQDNLTFAVHLQDKLNSKYPMLMRPINLRTSRFNQHTTKGSIILEVGSCGNTFAEALRGVELFGKGLAELILSKGSAGATD